MLWVVSGVSFYADIPCHYEPAMSMAGTIGRQGDFVEANFSIDVADAGKKRAICPYLTASRRGGYTILQQILGKLKTPRGCPVCTNDKFVAQKPEGEQL